MATEKTSATGKTKPQRITDEVGRIVGAGRAVQIETVDFNDPNRPKTCLEVDFPILAVNEIAKVESSSGAGRKPVYTMSKWWARRASSVFRTLLLAAASKAPEDAAESAKAVWDVYYANHQKKGSLKHLQVADIFMGGGTTIVEGSRLGMKMFGSDLNPVAWFIVRNELAAVSQEEVDALIADIEAEVKPQIAPFYACRGPHGELGKWTRISTGEVMSDSFNALALKPEDRKNFKYEGPELIYVLWAKHGPCQVTGCGQRTPVMGSPIIAVKELTVNAWPHTCKHCGAPFDIEECEVRMAPDVPLVLAADEVAFAVLNKKKNIVICPACHATELFPILAKPTKKKVALSLLVHPQWLQGAPSKDDSGDPFGGSVTDDVESSARWHRARAHKIRLLEVRGPLPDVVVCPETGVDVRTDKSGGTKAFEIKKDGSQGYLQSTFSCGANGHKNDVLDAIKASGKTGPIAAYAIQGYSPERHRQGAIYGGRYFLPADDTSAFEAAHREWELRKDLDLAAYWPRSELPFGFMTHLNNGGIPNHGFTHWWTMFNPRQLLSNALLLKSIMESGGERHKPEVRHFVLGAFLRFLQHSNMFCFWDEQQDCLAPSLANANFHPKSTLVENCLFPGLGRGNWRSSVKSLQDALEWRKNPWDPVSRERIRAINPVLANEVSGKTVKVPLGDAPSEEPSVIVCQSATELSTLTAGSFDLVITDPPFGGLLHYAELSDFFYVWLKLALRSRFPDYFSADYTPKTLEAVSNRARHPDDADAYYQRLLAASWKEAHRILKLGGILAFTFHHSEDAPWVAVLESLFEAGFYLEATWPIRSDETKGEGSKPGTFGSQKIEFDIIHVCRKRTEDPSPVSWAKMRRQVLQDVRGLKNMLEHHQKAGLPEADLQVIRRGKALEYFSRHYGKVLVNDGRPMDVLEALVGINQLLDEEAGGIKDPPPGLAEPFTRQFLRLFDGVKELPRDQIQKFLRGTGIAPSDFVARGWCNEEKKVYVLTPPLEVARAWQGKHRRGMTSDYDQATFLIGACFESSGINVTDTLGNDNFKPHPALNSLFDWFNKHGATLETRNAATRAKTILRAWRAKNEKQFEQMTLFFGDSDET